MTRTETRTDEQIQRDVLAELKWDARLQPNEIGVIVKDGVVTLTGWVVKAFFDAGKPVAVICHGPWTVIEAGAARDRRIASWPSLKTDLRNAGAEWVDEEVVVDGNLVSGRKPDDIPAFNREMMALFGQALRPAGRAKEAA